MRKNIGQMAIGLFFALLIGMLTSPLIYECVRRGQIANSLANLNRQMEYSNDEAIRTQHNLAQWYNLSLSANKPEETFRYAYEEILNFDNQMMGQIGIPSLGVVLPIYHGVSDDILEHGVGHLPETAFPIGGEGNHSVLVGKTELPGKRLFAEAAQLKRGDLFYIQLLGQTLAYEIEQVHMVAPGEVDRLKSVSGEDLCSLITVTPNGKQNDCLLVQGRRTELPDQNGMKTAASPKFGWVAAEIAAALLAGLIPLMAVRLCNRGVRKKDTAWMIKNV